MNFLRACRQYIKRKFKFKVPYVNNDLQIACENGNVKDVETILKQRDINPAYNNSWAFLQAVSNGHLEIVRLFVKHPRIDPCVFYFLPIRIASRKGYLEIVKLLLDEGPSWWRHDQAKNAIYPSIRNGHTEIVKLLFQYGVEIPQHQYSYIFEQVCRRGHLKMIELLIEKLNNIDLSWGVGIASRAGHLDVVKLLLQCGAQPTFQKNYALRWASKNCHLEVVKLLLENGANPTELAIRNANTDEMKELLVRWKYRVDGKEYCKAKEMIGL